MKFDSSSLNNIPRFRRWVATKAMSYHWHEFLFLMWPLLIPAWFIGFLLVELSLMGGDTTLAIVLIYVFLLSPVVFVLVLHHRVLQECKHVFARFLDDNKLQPNKSDGFRIELDGKTSARFQRIIKKVANKAESYYSAITIDLGEPIPEIVLDAKRNNRLLSSLPNYYNQDQRIRLEGNFDEYFDLYAPVKWRIEALSIITPDIMQALVKDGYNFDFEITAGASARLIISTPGYIGYDPIKLQALYDAFSSVYSEIKYKLRTLHIVNESPRSLALQSSKGVYSYAIFGKQIRLYRSLVYLWLSTGVILGILYLFGIRKYVEDLGFVYISVNMVLFFGYIKLKERS